MKHKAQFFCFVFVKKWSDVIKIVIMNISISNSNSITPFSHNGTDFNYLYFRMKLFNITCNSLLPSGGRDGPPAQWKRRSGTAEKKKRSTRWQRLCAHTLCVIKQRSGKFMRPLLHSFPVWQHFITEVPTQPGKTGHASVRFSQLTSVEVGRTISWLHYAPVTQMQLLLGWVDLYWVENLPPDYQMG